MYAYIVLFLRLSNVQYKVTNYFTHTCLYRLLRMQYYTITSLSITVQIMLFFSSQNIDISSIYSKIPLFRVPFLFCLKLNQRQLEEKYTVCRILVVFWGGWQRIIILWAAGFNRYTIRLLYGVHRVPSSPKDTLTQTTLTPPPPHISIS